ncbi:uncharacterized protein LOC132738934 isoform X2 [Ruditapes philippinarum]|uniref:uncharacterized protein LOC132738934 isoform X2 n=1 Tax=Ruditapes philippinarum TaxID=129788 RepID=UPI00295BA5E5|nr:uncharacterized protein LOC132738934 isoform X2 [Ruditapes philippinarum]
MTFLVVMEGCIRFEWRCDGVVNCWNGTDEQNCSHDICTDGQYMCENHVCISSSLKCDGNKDCLEGSDENDCPMTTLSSDPVPGSSTNTSTFIENKVDTNNDHRYSTDMRADDVVEMTTSSSGSDPSSSTNTSKFIENKVDTNNDHIYSTDMRADAIAEMTSSSSGSDPSSSTSTSMFIEAKVDKDNKRIYTLVVLLSVGGGFIVICAVTVVICIIKRRARKRQMPNNKNNAYPMLDVVPNTHKCASNNPTYGKTDTNLYEGLDRRGNASSEDLYQQLGYSNRDIMSAHLESQYVNTGTCYQQSHTDRRECSKDNNDEYESL